MAVAKITANIIPDKETEFKCNSQCVWLYSKKRNGISGKDANRNDQKVTVSGLYLRRSFLRRSVCITEKIVAKTKNKFPLTEASSPLEKTGMRTITRTPTKLTIVPYKTLIFNFSLRYKKEPIIKTIGPADKIIGALILEESFKPKLRRVIVNVIPTTERRSKSAMSFNCILRFLYTNGRIIIAAKKNLRKTKVNGGILLSVSL
jgi:hypothetical protein